jgi:riboflavin kinase / FMN hydrolase
LNILVDGHARAGVTAGKAAGMEVIAVPSIPKQADKFNSASEVLQSLLDYRPEKWGLPPFKDCKHKFYQ